MAWSFGDGFDCYAAVADAINGYWDTTGSATANLALVAGRFAGSQALRVNASSSNTLVKTSGVNDAVHHIAVAFQQTAAITGSTLGSYLLLSDGTTGQCAIVFRSDGAILLTSGSAVGTVLATYTGAFPVASTWYAFEFEIVINNATGVFRVRKNGNTSNDFDSGATLNTRPGTNTYANKLTFSMSSIVSTHVVDDLFWRSDASSVAWMGDIRCFTRMPASDASVQFSRTPASPYTQTPFTAFTTANINVNVPRYMPFTAAYDGTMATATVSLSTGYTGNMKCSVFASSGSAPTTVIGSATTITNPATGTNTFTFGTPITLVKGTQYWIGLCSDTTSGAFSVGSGTAGGTSPVTYASFPVASPGSFAASNPAICSFVLTLGSNATVVNEAQQDATTSYVYDSTAGHADFYGIAAIASTPVSTIAVTTRGYMQKSDAGSRTAAVQLKSGGTTVASPTLTLTTSGWTWAWRTDVNDPNTSAAWTAAAVNNVNVGPVVIS